MDSLAIADAIAARFLLTTPPSGQESIKVATARLPENVTVFPTFVVLPPQVTDIDYLPSRKRVLPLVYPSLLLLARYDGSPRRAQALHDWVTVSYGQLAGQMQLGLSSYVAYAWVTGFDAGAWTYAKEEYDGIRYLVRVQISESYTPVA